MATSYEPPADADRLIVQCEYGWLCRNRAKRLSAPVSTCSSPATWRDAIGPQRCNERTGSLYWPFVLLCDRHHRLHRSRYYSERR